MPLDFPANPVDGQVYDNYYYDSGMGTWRAYGTVNLAVPAGIINQYGGSVAPAGYLMCTGQSILTAEYPALFQAIGYAYGGSGANFIVPDLRSRVPVGKGVDVEFDTLGETGGAKTHTLITAEMPSHTHTQDAHNHSVTTNSAAEATTIGGYSPTYMRMFFGTDRAGSILNYSTAMQTTIATNQNTGGGGAHNNLQPYIVLNYIIKT